MIGGVLPPGFKEVLALVEERAGLAAPSCLAAALEGIQRAMARANQDDVDVYLRELSFDNALLDDLLTELTIGETYFFRTHEHFDHLRRVVLPELRERRGQGHLLRAWSAACSSGEEPYSIAALLMAEGWEERMTVRATDVSRTALQRAQQARYTDWSLRGPSADRMRPHLKQEGRFYWLSPDVKRHVQLGYLNLALETWPSTESGLWQMDVIFCRNVLIYFNRATIEGVARRLHASLEDGGYLFTGPSDPPLADYAPLEPVLTEWGVLYRKPLAGSNAGHFVPLQPLAPLRADGTPFTVGTPGAASGGRPGSGSFPAAAAPGASASPGARPSPAGGTAPGTLAAGMPATTGPAGATAGGSPPWASGLAGAGTGAPAPGPGSSGGGAPASGLGTPGGGAPSSGGALSGATPASGTPAVRTGDASTSGTRTRFTLSVEALEAVRAALARGDWREAARRAGAQSADPEGALAAVRALANLDPRAALFACEEASVRHPLVAGLRYLEALLLLGQGRLSDAEKSARQALYLEPGLAVGHLLLGHVLRRQDQTAAAARAYREAEGLCRKLSPEALVPLAEGERAGALADVARAEWRRLERTEG
ncbi:putative chemotaxis protein methyltransferase CheR [Corallococcus coralloides DSM 2259]|uniref:Putative chemotaxis protein methyltransferase CheR n=1 Tax=Corallococcus coralloides (strain ATCC 25202 / DSM 2259 / NBRC 100086 / M2) TaxID=1144275 RepID=H8MP37_CORCM|nr:protein-glutamate O-methyltransferase CheR [Corallococcus coralloides]AFE08834.1 putative chemotaxis protein methyltransferase CheR [Corallococcus coralloides DSM 2259]